MNKKFFSLFTVLLLLGSATSFGIANGQTIEITELPSVETGDSSASSTPSSGRLISVSLTESMGVKSSPPPKKQPVPVQPLSDSRTVTLSEDLTLETQTYDQVLTISTIVQPQTIMERLIQPSLRDNRRAPGILDTLIVDEPSVKASDVYGPLPTPLPTSPLQTTGFTDQLIAAFDLGQSSIIQYVEISKSLESVLVSSQTTVGVLAEPENGISLVILLPLVVFVLIRFEELEIKVQHLRQSLCFVFVLILLSSAVITPFDISSSYWPNAYAETMDDAQLDSDTQSQTSADAAASSTPADATTPAEESTSSDTQSQTSADAAASSTPADATTPAEESTSSDTQSQTSADAAASSTPADATTPAEESTSSDTQSQTSADAAASSTPADATTPAEESTSSDTQSQTSADAAASSTPADATTPAEESTSSDTQSQTSADAAASSTPADATTPAEESTSSDTQSQTSADAAASSTPADATTPAEESTSSDTQQLTVGNVTATNSTVTTTPAEIILPDTQPPVSVANATTSSTPAEDSVTTETTTSSDSDRISSENSTSTAQNVDRTASNMTAPDTQPPVSVANATTSSTPAEDSVTTETTTSSDSDRISSENSTSTAQNVDRIDVTNATTTLNGTAITNGTLISGVNGTDTTLSGNATTTLNGTAITNGTLISGVNGTDTTLSGNATTTLNGTAITNGTLISGVNGTDTTLSGNATTTLNGTAITNGTLISGVNGTDTTLSGNATTTLNGTAITNGTEISTPGTNQTTNEPVYVPNATESWQFDTIVNGSRFVGDVFIEENEPGLVIEGEGYVALDGNSTSQITNMTITAWIKPNYTDAASELTIVSKENTFSLTLNNNLEPQKVAKFSVFDGIKWHTVETSAPIGEDWSHLAAAFNGTTLAIYTNATLSNTISTEEQLTITIEGELEPKTPELVTSSSDVIVGATIDNTRSFDDIEKQFSGEIGEVNIYNVYLSAEQIAELYYSTLPVVFESNATQTEAIPEEVEAISLLVPTVNATQNNIATTNGTITTNSTLIETNATSIEQNATSIALNTTESYIVVPQQLNETINKFTISTFITPDYTDGSSEFAIVSLENSFVLSINNIIEPQHVAKFSVFDGIQWTDVVGTTPIENLSHVAAIINGTEISLFVNGTLQGTSVLPEGFALNEGKLSTTNADVAGSDADVVIGAYMTTVRDIDMSMHFYGIIDDVTIFKDALSVDEINDVYTQFTQPTQETVEQLPAELTQDNSTVTTRVSISDVVSVKLNDTVLASVYDSLGFAEQTTILLNNQTVPQTPIVPTLPASTNSTEIEESVVFDDSILVSLNNVTLNILPERITIVDDITLTLNNQTLSFLEIANTTSTLVHSEIEIGKPVEWVQTVSVNSTETDEVVVELPADAKDIEVEKIEVTNNVETFTALNDTTTENTVYVLDEQEIEQIEEEIAEEEVTQVPESPRTNVTAIAEFTNMTDVVVAPLDLATLEELTEVVQEEMPTKLLVINETKIANATRLAQTAPVESINSTSTEETQDNTNSTYKVKFETPAPYKLEHDNSTETTFNKKVTVAHNSTLHYTNVKSYSDLPEDLVQRGVEFKLHWMINGSKVNVTNDPRFNVEFVDTNDNGIADQMQWIVPQLSEQEFEIEAEIIIINVQSYPIVGENWVVAFNTTGTGNLTISAIDTTWSNVDEDTDLKFISLQCGNQTQSYQWINGTVFVPDYSCSETSYETSLELKPGIHTLEFRFGNDVGYAFNDATIISNVKRYTVNMPEASTSETFDVTGQTLTNAVPFVTHNIVGVGTNDAMRRHYVDVAFTDSNTVTLTRGTATSGIAINFEIAIVQFDPTSVRVQNGTYAMTNAVDTTDRVTLTTPIVAANTFPISYWTVTASGNDDLNDAAIVQYFSAADELTFQREVSGGTISGHWWAVEALDGSFSVQNATGTFTNAGGSMNLGSSVDSSKTFLIASYNTTETSDDSRDGVINAHLNNGTTTQINIGIGNGQAPAATSDVIAYAVTLSGEANVQRGHFTYAATTGTTATANINAVGNSTAMAWNPVLQSYGESDSRTAQNMLSARHSLVIDSSLTSVTGTRATAAVGNVDASFEVIDWTFFRPITESLPLSATASITIIPPPLTESLGFTEGLVETTIGVSTEVSESLGLNTVVTWDLTASRELTESFGLDDGTVDAEVITGTFVSLTESIGFTLQRNLDIPSSHTESLSLTADAVTVISIPLTESLGLDDTTTPVVAKITAITPTASLGLSAVATIPQIGVGLTESLGLADSVVPLQIVSVAKRQAVGDPAMIMLRGASGDVDNIVEQTMAWLVEERLDDGFTRPDSNNIKVDEAGIYRVSYGVYITTTGTGSAARHVALAHAEVNDANSNACYGSGFNRGDSGSQDLVATSECLLDLNANDEISIVVAKMDSNTGNGPAVDPNKSWFQVQKVDTSSNPSLVMEGDTDIAYTTPTDVTLDNVNTVDTSTFTHTDGSAEVTVKKAGFYKISYGAGTVSGSTGRSLTQATLHADLGGAGSFAAVPFGASTIYMRGTNGAQEGAMHASTIMNLAANDKVKLVVNIPDSTGHTLQDTQTHMDLEYIGSNANVLIIANTTGGGDIESADGFTGEILWNHDNSTGTDFTFSEPDDTITVNRAGMYHIGYAVGVEQTGANRFEFVTSLLVNDAEHTTCFGAGYARDATDDRGAAESSCYVMLDAGDTVKIRHTQTSNAGTGPVVIEAYPGRTYLSIHSVSALSTLTQSLGLSDGTVETMYNAAVDLSEALALDDTTVPVDTTLTGTIDLTQSLGLSDGIVDPTLTSTIDLTQSLGLSTVVTWDLTAAVDLTESLGIDDGTVLATTTILTTAVEPLGISAIATTTLTGTLDLTESLGLDDTTVPVDTTLTAIRNLSEPLGVAASAQGFLTFSASLTEGLTLADSVETTKFQSFTTGEKTGSSTAAIGSYTNQGSTSAVASIDGTVWGQGSAVTAFSLLATEGGNMTNFFNGIIPAESTIDRIEVSVTTAQTGISSYDYTTQLIDSSSTLVGSANSTGTTGLTQSSQTTIKHIFRGLGLTESDVDSSAFGVQFKVTAATTNSSPSVLVDKIALEVFYTTAGAQVFNEALTESLGFTATTTEDISIALTESLGLDDTTVPVDTTQTITVEVTDSLGLSDGTVDPTLTALVDLTESLGFDDTTVPVETTLDITVELTQSLSLVANTASTISIELTQALGLQADAASTISIALTESLGLQADTASTISIELTQALGLQANAANAISIALVESLGLQANAASVISIALVESLGLQADTASVISIALVESLGLQANTNSNISVALVESLGLQADATNVISIALVESLGLQANAASTISIALTESLGLQANTASTISIELTQALGLQANAANAISIALVESLGLQANAASVISITLVESLGLQADTASVISIALVESLGLQANTNSNISVALVESLGLQANAASVISIALVESLGLQADAASTISIALVESLGLQADTTSAISIALTESLGLQADATNVISIALVESLGLQADAASTISIALTETLGLQADTASVISIALVESLGLQANTNSNISVALVESLGLQANAASVISITLVESLGLQADAASTISIALVESLGLQADTTSAISIALTESLGLQADATNVISIALVESLGLQADAASTISIELTESIGLQADTTSAISIALTESLGLQADAANAISIALVESLGLQANAASVISITLVESLGLQADTASVISIELTQALGLQANTNSNISVALVESLGLQADATNVISIALVESLGLQADAASTISIALTETLGLQADTASVISIALVESLGLQANAANAISVALVESLGLQANAASVISIELIESLGLQADTASVISIELIESLGLQANAANAISIALVESLGLQANAASVISIELIESLGLQADAASTISIALVESLGLQANTNSNISVALVESLGLQANAANVISIALVESLGLQANAASVISIALVESLGLQANTNSNISIALVESLGLQANAANAISVALTESLGLQADATNVISIALVESLGLQANTNSNISVALVESLGLQANAANAISIALVESLGLQADADNVISVALTESLGLQADTASVISIELTQALGLQANTNSNISVALVESLGLQADATNVISIALVESLGLQADAASTISIALTETLGLQANTNSNISVALVESLGLQANAANVISIALVESLGLQADAASTISVSLIESLGLQANTNSAISIALIESLGLQADTTSAISIALTQALGLDDGNVFATTTILASLTESLGLQADTTSAISIALSQALNLQADTTSAISIALTESLGLQADADNVISVDLTESLGLQADTTSTISVALTESLGLQANTNNAISIGLTQALGLQADADNVISVDLTESLGLQADTTSAITVALTQALGLQANTNNAISIGLTQALGLQADADNVISVSLTESLGLQADAASTISVSLIESLGLQADTTSAISIALTQALGLQADADNVISVALTESLGLQANAASVISIALVESLGLQADTTSAISVALTESLGLDANTNNAASVDLTESLGLQADTKSAISIALTETIGLQADADNTISVSITESLGLQANADTTTAFTTSLTQALGLQANAANAISVALTESLGLQANAANAITVTLTESLGLQANTDTASTLTTSLTESLGLQANAANAISIALTESLGLQANATTASALTTSLTESLGLQANAANAITVTLTESLGLQANTNSAITVALTQALGLDDGTVFATTTIQALLTESLGLQANAANAISVTLTESLGLQANAANAISVTLTESLGLQANAANAITVTLTESLGLQANTANAFSIMLTDSLGLQANAANAISIAITESLGLDETTVPVDTTLIAIRSLSESIGFVATPIAGTFITLSESLSLDDGTVNADLAVVTQLTESLGLNDNTVTLTQTITTTLTESLSFQESLNLAIPSSLTQSLGLSDTVFTVPVGAVPSMISLSAGDPDGITSGEATGFTDGDTITVTFSRATNRPDVATKSDLENLFTFSQTLGTNYVGTWTSSSVLTITVTNVTGNAVTIGGLTLTLKSGGELKNAAETSAVATSSSPALSGDFGTIPGPIVSSITADGINGGDQVYGNADRITVAFDEDTDRAGLGTGTLTKAQLDGLFTFSQSLGTDYTGQFTDAQTLVITVVDATGATPPDTDMFSLTIKADGTNDLKNAAGTSAASTAMSPTLVGTFGGIVGPEILTLTAADPDGGDAVYGNGDVITVKFAEDTNRAGFAVGATITKAQLDGLFTFSQSLGTDYTGKFIDAATLEITVVNANGSTPPAVDTFRITIKADGTNDLRNAAATSLASEALSPLLQGNFGVKAGPGVGVVIASDPDDGDAVYGNGDTITVTFLENTNRPTITTKADLDTLFTFSQSLGTDYIGSWVNPSTLVITVIDSTGHGTPTPGTFTVTVKASGVLKDEAETTLASVATSPALDGSFGDKAGPAFSSIVAADPDTGDAIFSNGDTVTIEFLEDTNRAGFAVGATLTKAQLDSIFVFSQSLGSGYTGSWSSSSVLVITVNDAEIDVAPKIGELKLTVKSGANLKDSAASSLASTAVSTVLEGTWGTKEGPSIIELVALDPRGSNAGFGAGDRVTVEFSEPTNLAGFTQGATLTKAQVDTLFTFSQSFGTDYTGQFITPTTLEITIVDATGATPPATGVLRLTLLAAANLKNSAGTSLASTAVSTPLSGTFAAAPGPSINYLEVSDPDGADAVYGNGDQITVTFSEATNTAGFNVGTTLTKAQLDGLLTFSSSLGTDYTGEFIDPLTLEITIVDSTGHGSPALGTFTVTVKADGTNDLKTAADTSLSSTDTSVTLVGSFGDKAGPLIKAVIADDPDNADSVYSTSDTITVRFSENTNQPAVATTANLDNLFVFSQSIGNSYSGEWTNALTLKITINDAGIDAAPQIGELRLTVKSTGNLKNAAGTSLASTSISQPLTGNFGTFNDPIPVAAGGTAFTTLPTGIFANLTLPDTVSGTVTISRTTAASTDASGSTATITFLGNVVDITPSNGASCTLGCPIEFIFTQADADQFGITPANMKIFHDLNGDSDFNDANEVLDSTTVTEIEPGLFRAVATINSNSKFAIGGVALILLPTVSSPAIIESNPAGNSGGGGSGGGASAAGGIGGILSSTLAINEISYDVCTTNMATILVSNDGTVVPSVKIRTTQSGVIAAALADEQPYAEQNEISTINRYVFEAPISPDESFFLVQVEEIGGRTSNIIQSGMSISGCEGSAVIVDPIEDDTVAVDREISSDIRIFDVKHQVGTQGTVQADYDVGTYADNESITVTAIVDSVQPLKRSELRFITLGQTVADYTAIKMTITPLAVSNSTYVVSATIPVENIRSPAITYWLHTISEDTKIRDTKQYTIGVKSSHVMPDAIVELDTRRVVAQGSTFKPAAYVTNNAGQAVFATIHLIVDGESVHAVDKLLAPGETKVDLEWLLPKQQQQMVYDVQAQVNVYDASFTTVPAQLNAFAKNAVINISEQSELDLITFDDGKPMIRAALLYASNPSSATTNFRVTAPDGTCVIGSSSVCLIKDSTAGKRGGLESIMLGDQIYRIKYSGGDNPLERFSITSIDPIVGKWHVELESKDGGLLPDAQASDDVEIKIKFKSEDRKLVTVSSEIEEEQAPQVITPDELKAVAVEEDLL